MPKYFYNNQPITEAKVLELAKAENMTFDDFLNSSKDIEVREDDSETNGSTIVEIDISSAPIDQTIDLPQVTKQDVRKTEEDAIKILKKKYGGLGFEFEESGWYGDYITIKAPDTYDNQGNLIEGESKRFDFDVFWSSSKKEANEINEFIAKHANNANVSEGINTNQYANAWGFIDSKAQQVDINDMSSKELVDFSNSILKELDKSKDITGISERIQANMGDFQRKIISDLRKKYDVNTIDGSNSALEEYNKLLNEEFYKRILADEEYQKLKKSNTMAVRSYFGQDIEKIIRDEGELEVMPNWVNKNPVMNNLVKGVWGTANIKLPKSYYEFSGLNQAKKLENIYSEIQKYEAMDPNEKVRYSDYSSDPNLNIANKEYTAGELVELLKRNKGVYEEGIAHNIIKSNEYQEKLSKIKLPKIFEDDGVGLSGEEFWRIIGDQSVQMIGAALSLGGTTLMQEGGGAYAEITTAKAAMKMFPGLDKNQAIQAFKELDMEKQTAAILDLIEKGEGDLNTAFNIGVKNAGLDLIGNFVVIGKAAKFLPKSLGRDFLGERYKDFLKGGWRTVGKDVTIGSFAEVATEIAQEGINIFGVGKSTGENIKDMWTTENGTRLLEAGAQALIATGPIIVGGQAVSTVTKEIATQISAIKNPDHQRNYINLKKKEIDKQFKNGRWTREERDNLFTKLEGYEQSFNFENLDGDGRKDVVNKLTEKAKNDIKINKLEEKIKKQNKEFADAGLDQTTNVIDEIEIKDLKRSNKSINDGIIKEVLASNYRSSGKTLAQWVNEQKEGLFKDKQVITFDNLEQATEYVVKNNIKFNSKKQKQKFLNGEVNGVNLGDTALIVDKVVNKNIKNNKWNSSNTIHHEVLHFILDTIDTKKLQGMIKSTMSKLKNSTDPTMSKVYELTMEQFSQYYFDKNVSDDVLAEEFFTALSDAMQFMKLADLNVENGSVLNDIGKTLQNIFSKNTNASIDFSGLNAENMIEFIKKYNDFNGKGQKYDPIKIKGATDVKEPEVKESIPTLSREEVKQIQERVTEIGLTYNMEGGKKLWDEGGSKAAIEEIKKDGLLDNLIASKYKVRPVPETFVSDVIAQLLPDIRGFNPEINNDLGGYLGSRVNFRAGDVYNKLYKDKGPKKTVRTEEKTKEGEVRVQVAAEKDPTLEAFETEDLSFAGRAKRRAESNKKNQVQYSKLRKAMGVELGSDLYNRVLDGSKKALIRAYETGKPVRQIQRDLKDAANTYIFKTVKNFLGTKTYISNLRKLREPIINSMFTADLVQMEREVADDKKVFTKFVKQLTSKEQVQSAVNQNLLPPSALNTIDRGQAVNLYEKVMPTEEQFVAFFDQPAINPVTGRRSGLKGTRKDQLAKYMANSLSLDAMLQVAKDPDVAQKRQGFAELRGESLAENDLQVLAANIGRDINVKFSEVSNTIDYNLIDNTIKLLKLTKPQAKKFLSVLDTKIDKTKDEYTKSILQELRNNFDLNVELRDTKIADIPFTNIIDTDAIVTDVKKTYMSEIRQIGHDAFVELLQDADLATVTEFVKNVFRSSRSAPGVMTGFTNEILKTEVLDKIQDGRFVDDFVLVTVPNGKAIANKKGEIIELYESIENIKDNVRNNAKLVDKVNKQAEEAQKFIFKILDSNLTRGKKIAMIQLIAYDQRGAVRKASKMGITLNKQSNLTFKSLTLDHEVTINDTVDTLIDYINGKVERTDVENMFDKSFVHVIPNNIDKALTDRGYKSKGGLNRYDNILDLLLEAEKQGVLTLTDELAARAKDDSTVGNIVKESRTSSKTSKGITILDFDDTLATTKSMIRFTRPDGTEGKLNAEQYASTYEDLLGKGYIFNFSEFSEVVGGKPAPLLNKAKKLAGKFGTKDMFILTARPADSAPAIQRFLKANGLNIPLKNITGLGNSTSEAKALWVLDKAQEGYNDFYFADDALQNVQAVQNMLNQVDVKSKIQQAKVKFSKAMSIDFNKILEEITGIESKKRFSAIKARKRGENKGKFRFFIPPSHEDFVGLLYNFMGKGRRGDAHRDFFEKALIRPLNRAYRELNITKQAIANDYKSLNKRFKDVKDKLTKKTPDGDFTYNDAIRVYLWDKHGHKIPGLSETDQKNLVDIVNNDPQLRSYSRLLNVISKQEKYIAPTESWEGGDIRTDLDDATGRVGREQFFVEFFENADIIFSPENLNKIEAAYGADMVSALKDILYRTKTGRNRPSGQNKLVNQFLNYLNGSVASTMFFNIRSAVLQQMSMVNFINFSDNNIFTAAKAFANQKQYWTDWATIFNSDFMKQRRGGIKTDVNGAELAATVKDAKNPVQATIKKLLELGFLPTQIGDNIAIASGGATFYRNRINTYLKQGLSKKEAEAKAWTDFEILAEATQQSARPDMVSQQQASPLGKVILAFQNVTSQFNRLGKKAFLDLKNRRITPGNQTQLQSDMSNLSRIAYYLAIQNLIFYSLQSALFMAMFDDDEEDERWLKKKERMVNGSIDSVLRGTGVWGAAVATLKNMAIKWHEQRDKGYNADESAVLMEMLNVSPPLGIKARKIVNAEKTLNYNKKTIEEMETFDIDNPQWSAVTNYIEATTNVPLNRLYNKTQNVRESLDNQHNALERVLMFSGWSKWNLGIEDVKKSKKKQDFSIKVKSKRIIVPRETKKRTIIRR